MHENIQVLLQNISAPVTVEYISSVIYKPLICHATGLYYNPIASKIPLPSGVSVAYISHNTGYYKHTVTLEGVYMARRFRMLISHSQQAIAVSQSGHILTIHTRPGITLHYCYAYIRLINLREIYHTIIVIDPGHGGIDSGALNVLGRDAPSEADIVLEISQKLLNIFDEPGVLLIPTRTTDVAVYPSDRYTPANKIADFFISIHTNAYDRSRLADGMLTLYGNAPGSAELAYAFQTALVDALGSRDRGTEHSPAIRVLRRSIVPSILLEIMFLSNPQEAVRLSDPDIQLLIAHTLAETIRNHVNIFIEDMYNSYDYVPY